ncbi:MAG: threonine/serine exporter family protein [Intrasporangium sp.]|uniref:threonine/serine ThrE exporter family protein n=1 Tax=Intrasporangium sp. TaxID=1925024 RepID=UPI0026479286|nr:threonine/serine exporter family protein [Intrasporangium sp.]MDN5796656.1 threonine/serine exporter family protein [Intrasporangium sp.]
MAQTELEDTRECLLRVGAALLAGGAPGPEVEEQVVAIGRHRGIPDVRAAATPTGVFVSTTPDHTVAFEPVTGTLRFEQTTLVQGVIDRLLTGRLGPAAAVAELTAIERLPPSRPAWLCDLAIVPIAVGICAILQPTWRDLGAAAIGSLLLVALVNLSRRSPLVRTLLPLLAAFGVTSVVLQLGVWWPLDGTLRTVVSTIAVLLPGSMIVTGITEIATGSAVAGTSRLVSGTVQLVLFAVGLFAAAAVRGAPLTVLTNVRADDLNPGGPFVGILLVGVGIVINVAASRSAIPWILGVLLLTFAVQYAGQSLWGVTLGALAASAVAGLSASIVPWLSGRPLRLVVYLPAFWLLVPGSLGLLSTAQIATGRGDVSAVTGAVAAAVAIVVGTLAGSAAGRALDRWLTRRGPGRADAAEVPDVERR